MKDGRTRSFKVISWAIWLQTMAHRLWAIIYWSIILTWSFWKQTFVINPTKSGNDQSIRTINLRTVWTINKTTSWLFHTRVWGAALRLMTNIPTITTAVFSSRCRTSSKSSLGIRAGDIIPGRTTVPVTWFLITVSKVKRSIDWTAMDSESVTSYHTTLKA